MYRYNTIFGWTTSWVVQIHFKIHKTWQIYYSMSIYELLRAPDILSQEAITSEKRHLPDMERTGVQSKWEPIPFLLDRSSRVLFKIACALGKLKITKIVALTECKKKKKKKKKKKRKRKIYEVCLVALNSLKENWFVALITQARQSILYPHYYSKQYRSLPWSLT